MLTRRQTKFALTTISGVLLTGVILLAANILLNWVYFRLDLTRSQAYSLSSSSKKLIRQLEDPVVIKAYFSTELPPPYNTFSRYVKDVLAEYRSASKGRVRFEFVRTAPQREFEEKAMTAGMQPIQFEQMGADQMQIQRGYMGLGIYYRDRSEILPLVRDPNHLEYDLTSRISRMARKEKKKIATLSGHGEPSLQNSQLKLAQDLPAFYDLNQHVTLPPLTTGPITADALLVAGPQSQYDEKSLWTIDQTLMKGVPVAFLVDTKRFTAGQFVMMPLRTGLEDLLKTYGVQLTDRLVLDAQCESVGMTQSIGGMQFTTSIRYPFVPQITHFAEKHPILSGLTSVSFAFPTQIDKTSALPAGVTYTPLLFTSDRSWLAPSTQFNVAPNSIPQAKPGEPHGPYVVGAVLEGTFPSYFAGKPSPAPGQTAIPQSPKTTIFILPTSHVLDESLPNFAGTDALITNALAYLSHDETLIGIQAKGDIIRPLKPTNDPVRNLVKLICIFLIPALPVLWGLLRWRRRESWRARIAQQFQPAPVPAPAPVPQQS